MTRFYNSISRRACNLKVVTWLISMLGSISVSSVCTLSVHAEQVVAPSGWVEDVPGAKNAPVAPDPGSALQESGAPPLIPGGTAKTALQGGVEHSVELRPLPSNLQTGAIFDERSIPQTADQTGWYKIPNWLAGKWLREEETILSTYFFDSGNKQSEPRTIAEREIAEFGFQRDKMGQVWHYRLANKGVSDCGSYLAIAFVEIQEPLQISDDLVVIRDVFVEVQVNKETNVILHSSQAESITRYRPVRNGLLKTTMSVKTFKEDGRPYTVQKNIAYDKRIQEFSVTDSYKGKNLRQHFSDFLRSQGHDELVP